MSISLNSWNIHVNDCSTTENSFIPAHEFFFPSSNYINGYINICLLHQSTSLGNSYASGLKESSFDVTKEHFMPSG